MRKDWGFIACTERFTYLDKLYLVKFANDGFDFRIKSIFSIAAAASKRYAHLKNA